MHHSLLKGKLLLSLLAAHLLIYGGHSCEVPRAPTNVDILVDNAGDGRLVLISASNASANTNRFQFSVIDYYQDTLVHENAALGLGQTLSVDLPKYGTVYDFEVYSVTDCGNGTTLITQTAFQELYLTEPPTIQTDVDVIFQNSTYVCFIWTFSRDEANFDEIHTKLMQGGQTYDTVTSTVQDTQEIGQQCLDIPSSVNLQQFFSLQITAKVSYDDLQMTSNSAPGYRNLEASSKDFNLMVEVAHCDGETCLVNIEASQLAHREEFDYNYQMFKDGSDSSMQSGLFLGSDCDETDNDFCTYLIDGLEPHTRYTVEITPSLEGDSLPFMFEDNFETTETMPYPSDDEIALDCTTQSEGMLACELRVTDEQLTDRYSFRISYNVTSVGQTLLLSDTIQGEQCKGNIKSCIIELSEQLESSEYIISISIDMDGVITVLPDAQVQAADNTGGADDEGESSNTTVIVITVLACMIGSVLIGLILFLLYKNKIKENDKSFKQLNTTTEVNTYFPGVEPQYESPDGWEQNKKTKAGDTDSVYDEYKEQDDNQNVKPDGEHYAKPDASRDRANTYLNSDEQPGEVADYVNPDDGDIGKKIGENLDGPTNRRDTIANEYTSEDANDTPDQTEIGHQNGGFENDNTYAENGLSPYVPASSGYVAPSTNYPDDTWSQTGDLEGKKPIDNEQVLPIGGNHRARLQTNENLYVTSNDMRNRNVNDNHFNREMEENIDDDLKNAEFEKDDDDDLDKGKNKTMANEYISPSS